MKYLNKKAIPNKVILQKSKREIIMNEKKLARDELIGMNVKIIKSSDPNWTKKTGIIIDETKNTFLIKIDKKNKRIAKNIAEFEFEHNGKLVRLNGSKISYKPEDRIKKI